MALFLYSSRSLSVPGLNCLLCVTDLRLPQNNSRQPNGNRSKLLFRDSGVSFIWNAQLKCNLLRTAFYGKCCHCARLELGGSDCHAAADKRRHAEHLCTRGKIDVAKKLVT